MAVEATVVIRLRYEMDEDELRERIEREFEAEDAVVTTVEQEDV